MSMVCDQGCLYCPFAGCASSCLGGSDVSPRPYHRDCKCYLHNATLGGSSGLGSKMKRNSSLRVKVISSRKQGAAADHHQQLVLINERRTASFSDLTIANSGGLGLQRSSSSSDLAGMSPGLNSQSPFSVFYTGFAEINEEGQSPMHSP